MVKMKKSTRTNNVIKNSSASLFFRAMQMLTQFALRTAFIYILGKEYTGVSGLFTDILNVLSLMELGLDGSMVFSLYKPLAEHDVDKISALINFYRKAFFLIGWTVLVAGVGCIPFLRYIVKDVVTIEEDIRVIFLMYVVTAAFSYFWIYKSILFQADQKSRIVYLFNTVFQFIESAIEILLLIIFKEFLIYLSIRFIFAILQNIILSKIAERKYHEIFRNKEARLSKEENRELIKYIAALCVYNLSGVVINSTDSIFISAFVGTVEVALIGNFTLIISNIRKLIQNVVKATKPSVGNLATTSLPQKQKDVFSRMNFISFWVACVCSTMLFTLLNPFIGNIWFDTSYTIPMATITVLTVNFYIAVMVYPVETFKEGNGIIRQGWYRPLIMAILNIVLDFYLGRIWGIWGIFFATTISRVLTQVWFDIYLLSKYVFKEFPKQYYIQYGVQIVVMGICCWGAYFINNLYEFNNVYFEFFVKAVVAFFLSNAIIIVLYYKTKEFKSVLNLAGNFLHRCGM